jgi:Helix-turn-helix domain of resolvase
MLTVDVTLATARSPARRARNHPIGRPKAIAPEKAALAGGMRDAGEPVPAIASTLGVGRATVYRPIAETEAEQNESEGSAMRIRVRQINRRVKGKSVSRCQAVCTEDSREYCETFDTRELAEVKLDSVKRDCHKDNHRGSA